MNTLERIKKQLEIQAETQDEVQEFDIEYIKIQEFTPQLAALFKPYIKITNLGFSGCSLTSLNNFPKIENLENLILEDNQLNSSALKYIAENYKNLICLSLSQNKIKSFEEIEILKALPRLQQLDLSDNPISELPGYHEKMFKIFPQLKVLDNKNEQGEEIMYSDEEEEAAEFEKAQNQKFNIDESESSSGSEIREAKEGELKQFDDDLDDEDQFKNNENLDDSYEDDYHDDNNNNDDDGDLDEQPFKRRKNR